MAKRALHFLLIHRLDIAACTLIIAVTAALGYALEAWSGDLKGDDAYFHLGTIQYILDSFPQLSWYHQAFAGYPALQFESPLYYFGIAIAHAITGISLTFLLQASLFLSMSALGISVYALSRVVGLPRLLSIGIALLIFSIPEVWNWIVIGGAYKRIVALPFLFLSIALVYRHIRQVNGDSETLKTYGMTVALLAVTAMLHPIVWQWGFLMTALVYLVGIKGWRRKISTSIKVFAPVSGLAAWLYFPVLKVYPSVASPLTPGTSPHETTPMEWHWLLPTISLDSFSNNIGPIVLPLLILTLILGVALYPKLRHSLPNLGTEFAFLSTFCVFGIYFLILGWVSVPRQLYLMASYDNAIWLGICALLVFALTLAALLKSAHLRGFNRYAALGIQTVFIGVVLAGVFATVPFLREFTQVDSPRSPDSLTHEIARVIDTAKASTGPGYRLHSAQREVTKWLYAEDPQVSTTGGRSKNNAPHKYYNQWADSVVSYRLDQDRIDEVYFDDRPQVLRPPVGGGDNFYSSMFWLDWYAASGPIMIPGLYPQQATNAGYSDRPQFFREQSVPTDIGELFFHEYPESSPVVIAPSAYAIAVPYTQGDAPTIYVNFLEMLASLNLNSQWVIPVKLDKDAGLERFSTALVSSDQFDKHRDRLNQFARDGGHLVVMGQGGPEYALAAESSLVSRAFRPDGSTPEIGVSLSNAPGNSVTYNRTELGLGTVTEVHASMGDLMARDNIAAAASLAQAIIPELKVLRWSAGDKALDESGQTVTGQEWTVDWTTSEARGIINPRDGFDEVIAQFRGGASHDQVNFKLSLSGRLSVVTNGFVDFEIWSDHQPIVDIGLATREQYSTHRVAIRQGEWVRNVIPLPAFTFPLGKFNISEDLVLVVNDNPDIGLIGNGDRVIVRVRNLKVFSNIWKPAIYDFDRSQVNLPLGIRDPVDTNVNGLVTFSAWHDGKPTAGIDVVLKNFTGPGSLTYSLTESEWQGWQEFVIPLAAFKSTDPNRLDTFDSITLVAHHDPESAGLLVDREFAVRGMEVTSIPTPGPYDTLEGTWLKANTFQLGVKGSPVVLWKQSHRDAWRVTDDQGREVEYFFAGPGMMYILVPDGASTLTFVMPTSPDLIWGIGISVATLTAIIYYILAVRVFPLPLLSLNLGPIRISIVTPLRPAVRPGEPL